MAVAAALLLLFLARVDLQSVSPGPDQAGVPADAHSSMGSPPVAARRAVGSLDRTPHDRASRGIPVRVRDAGTGRPLAAEVSWRATAGAGELLVYTGEGGVAWLPDWVSSAGDGRLRAAAAGYLASRTAGTVPAGGLDVVLIPAAELELRFRDVDGQPVEGVVARLLPPVVEGPELGAQWRRELDPGTGAGRSETRYAWAPPDRVPDRAPTGARDQQEATWPAAPGLRRRFDPRAEALGEELEWTRSSGADGRVLWEGLPPGSGWRWGLVSEHRMALEPGHEALRVPVTSGGLLVIGSGRAPADLSGRIELRPGERTAFELTVRREGSVRGRLPRSGGPSSGPAQVKIYHGVRRPLSDGRTVEGEELEAFTTSDTSGRFAFEGLAPGTKLLRAYWVEEPLDYRFAALQFELPDGASVDLGVVLPLVGSTVEGVVRLVEAGGGPIGQDELFGTHEALPIVLELNTLGRPHDEERRIFEQVGVPLGAPFRLHGVPPGTLHAWAAPAPERWPALLDPGTTRLHRRALAELEVPTHEPLELDLRVERLVERELRVRFPAGVEPVGLHAYLLPAGGGSIRRERLLLPHGAGRAEVSEGALRGRLRLAPGRWHLLVRPDDGGGLFATIPGIGGRAWRPDELPSLFAQATVEVGPQRNAPIELDLRPAASLAGLLLGPGGRPRPGGLVILACEPWASATGGSRPFWSKADAEGRFHLGGLVPDASYAGPGGGPPVATGPPGSLREVVVTSAY